MGDYIIGVDGGNTKTHYALFDTQGVLVRFLTGGTASHENFDDGYEGTERTFRAAFESLFDGLGITSAQVRSAVFGLAGADIPDQCRALEEVLGSLGFPKCQVVNDAFLGIKAGTGSGIGLCSINGTGSVCTGVDPGGNRVQIGGLGSFSGDEAGGDHLRDQLHKAVYNQLFRDGPKTKLADLVFRRLGVVSSEDLVLARYRDDFDDRIGPDLVFEAAAQDDCVALDLLVQMGRHAAANVASAFRRLDFSATAEIEVVLAGSVFVKGAHSAHRLAFQEEVQRALGERARFHLLKEPPVAGAVLWAFEAAGLPVTRELRSRILGAMP